MTQEKELNEIWEYVKKHDIVEKLKEKKEEELGKVLGEIEIAEKSFIEGFLGRVEGEEIIVPSDYFEKYLKGEGRTVKRIKETVNDEKLKEVCQIKIEIKNLEVIKKLEEEPTSDLKFKDLKVRHIKSALNYIIEIDSRNEELKKKVKELEENAKFGASGKESQGIKKAPEVPSILVKTNIPERENYDKWEGYGKNKEIKIHPDDREAKEDIEKNALSIEWLEEIEVRKDDSFECHVCKSKIDEHYCHKSIKESGNEVKWCIRCREKELNKLPNKLYEVRGKKVKTKEEIIIIHRLEAIDEWRDIKEERRQDFIKEKIKKDSSFKQPSRVLNEARILINSEKEKDTESKKVTSFEEKEKSIIYAVLSYVCNDQMGQDIESVGSEKFKLSASSRKSLDKAIKTCEGLNVDYLWMDKLCIDQNDKKEKAKEVRNMYRNYNNSAVTLIAIHKKVDDSGEKAEEWDRNSLKVLEKIINSEWFSRSWTFQEGWLSKRTLFMFDDMIIDGSFLAQVWAYNQSADAEGRYSNHKQIEEKSVKIATPIGWVRYKDKDGNSYGSNDRLTFCLYEALRGIKERKRGTSIDGIYTILGLLPYGDKVEVEYKSRRCKDCGGEETKDCSHDEKSKEWPIYDKEDLRKALVKVMKVAGEHGICEFLAWYGLNAGKKGKSWLPKIRTGNKDGSDGSVEVWGGINIECEPKSIRFRTDDFIELKVSKYYINNKSGNIIGIGGKSLLSGFYLEKIDVQVEGGRKEEIKIWGTKETLREVDSGNYLLIIDENKAKASNMTFGILALRSEGGYQRIGLVELEIEDREKLKLGWKDDNIEIHLDEGDFYNDVSQTVAEALNQETSNLEEKIKSLEDQVQQLKNQKGGLTHENKELQKELQSLVKFLYEHWKKELDSLIDELKFRLNSTSYTSIDDLLEKNKDNENKLKDELRNNVVKEFASFFSSSSKLKEDEIKEICQRRTELNKVEEKMAELNRVNKIDSREYKEATASEVIADSSQSQFEALEQLPPK